MAEGIKITPPLTDEVVENLKAGDKVLITGTIYTARDSAHKRLMELIDKGEELPFPIEGAIIYYVGPTPAREGEPIGSAGPTTSGRMDKFTPKLHDLGLKATMGKGLRSAEVKKSLQDNKAVYLGAVGGAAALIKKSIKAAKVIAYDDLGPEAIRELVVEEFPAIVVNDCHGGDLTVMGVEKYKKTS